MGPWKRRRSQVVPDLTPGGAVVVSTHVNLYFQGDTCLFLAGGFPIDEHRVGGRAARNSIQARCVDMGLATARQIAGPTGVSVRIAHRVVRQRRQEGWDSFGRKPSRPGRDKQQRNQMDARAQQGRAGRPAQGHAPRLTLVLDRGGSSHGLFDELDRLGVAFITWRTGTQEPWPEEEFRQLQYPVAMALGEREVTARCAERRGSLNDRDGW